MHAMSALAERRGFLPDQLKLTLFALPLWMAGFYFYFSRAGSRFRALGWMYLVPLLLFVMAKGRGDYLATAYPMLYAGGSVRGEPWLASLPRQRAGVMRAMAWTALVANIVIGAALTLPIAPVNSAWWKIAVKNNGDFREEIGWSELVETVAQIRDSLPAKDRAQMGILAGNYGEARTINLFGPRYRLPQAISGTNSFWQRGHGNPPPQTLIVVETLRGHEFRGV